MIHASCYTCAFGFPAALFLPLCFSHDISLRGVTLAVGVLVVEVQPALVEVRLDILGDGLAVISLDTLHQNSLATLQVGTLLAGKLHIPHLIRNLEFRTLLETVRSA